MGEENKCFFCGKEIDYLPYKCRYCGESFCLEHRLPEGHYCEGLEKWKRGELKKFKKPIKTIKTNKPFLESYDWNFRPSRKNNKINKIILIISLIVLGYFIYSALISNNLIKQGEYQISIVTTSKTTTTTVSHELNIQQMEKDIHELINEKIKENGLTDLSWNEELTKIARGHSEDMAVNHYFSHYDLQGKDFAYRYEEAGFDCKILYKKEGDTSYFAKGGENIFQNNRYDSITYINGVPIYNWNTQEEIVKSTVDGWMNSEGHRQNILTPYWKSEGIGIAISDDDKIYITEDFC